MISLRSWWVVPGSCHSAGRSEERAAIRARSSRPEPRWLFAEEPVVIVPHVMLGAQRLLPPLLQGACHEAVLRVDGPVTPFGIFGLVSGLLQSLFPVLVQAGSIPLERLHGLATQFQRGGFQGAKDLLGHEVVDDGGLESVTGLIRPFLEVPDAAVMGSVSRPIGSLEATTAIAADHQAGEQSGAVAGSPLGARARAVWRKRS